MFESAEIGHVIDKSTYKAEEAALREALLDAQYELRQRGDFPVLILIHGMDGAGRGETLNQINEWLDPRLIHTAAFDKPNDDARERPWMWRYWRELPQKGRIGMFFGSYYSDAMFERVEGGSRDALDRKLFDILRLERMLSNDGVLVLKFWLHLTRDVQKKRFKALEKDPATAWRVSNADWQHFEQYDRIKKTAEHIMRLTNTSNSPWLVVNGEDANYRSLTVGRALLSALKQRLEMDHSWQPRSDAAPITPPLDNKLLLESLQLDQPLSKSDYQQQLEMLQGRLNKLTRHPKFGELARGVRSPHHEAAVSTSH